MEQMDYRNMIKFIQNSAKDNRNNSYKFQTPLLFNSVGKNKHQKRKKFNLNFINNKLQTEPQLK